MQGTPASRQAASTPATVLPRALWRSTEPSAVRQSAAPGEQAAQPDELDHGLAARARIRAERVERGAEPARGARARALRDVAAERLSEACERAIERLDVRAPQALLRPEQRGRAIRPAERHVHVVQDAQLDAAEERSRGREIQLELAEQRLAGRSRHARAQAREHPEAAVDGGRAAEPDEHARGAALERGAQQIGEAGRARAARIALAAAPAAPRPTASAASTRNVPPPQSPIAARRGRPSASRASTSTRSRRARPRRRRRAFPRRRRPGRT